MNEMKDVDEGAYFLVEKAYHNNMGQTHVQE